MAAPTEAVCGEVVNTRRRRPKSQVCCDHRERRTLCCATPKGSAANGIASQSKVVRSGRGNLQRKVFVAREHNLASSGFGSGRCRGKSPEHGTPSLPRKPRRMESAKARGDVCGTCRIDAHASVWAECLADSVRGKIPGVIGRGGAVGSSLRADGIEGGTGGFCFHRMAVLDDAAKIIGFKAKYSACVLFAGCCVNLL